MEASSPAGGRSRREQEDRAGARAHQILHELNPRQGPSVGALAELFEQQDGVIRDYGRLKAQSSQDGVPGK